MSEPRATWPTGEDNRRFNEVFGPFTAGWVQADYEVVENYITTALEKLRAAEQQRDDLLAEVARLKSQAPYVEASGHYCDGMTAAWTDVQAIGQERDDLLAALEGVVGLIDDAPPAKGWQETRDALTTARALITRIKHPEGG